MKSPKTTAFGAAGGLALIQQALADGFQTADIGLLVAGAALILQGLFTQDKNTGESRS